ncbi:unnamed protein product [Agarophyton chilense]
MALLFVFPPALPSSHRSIPRSSVRCNRAAHKPPTPTLPPSSPSLPPPFREVSRSPPGLTVLYSRADSPITPSNLPQLLAFVRERPRVLLAVAPHVTLPRGPSEALASLGVRLVRRSVLSGPPRRARTTFLQPLYRGRPAVRKHRFELHAPYALAGSQSHAVQCLADGLLQQGKVFQTLAGVTGSGKSYMMASVITAAQVPTLILAPNKTLAAQLYNQFKLFFPRNRVEFFVSNFKHYQPEAYLPSCDKYIAKTSSIDHELDQLRHAATKSLFERNDTIVIASVSSIYGLGLPTEYLQAAFPARKGDSLTPQGFVDILKSINYVDDAMKIETTRGLFRQAQQVIDVSPPWEQPGILYRFSFDDSKLTALQRVNINLSTTEDLGEQLVLYPAKHFVTPKHRLEKAIEMIEEETRSSVQVFIENGKILEATRLQERVEVDMKMLRNVGFCQGIENYSMYLSGRDCSQPPETLLDYMPRDGKWLLFIDESHVTVPQLGGMYAGNAARKKKLVQHGFRLPSALENRPLSSREFWKKAHQTIFVSATPGYFERKRSGSEGMIEAVIRPTGVLDPTVEVVGTKCQIEHLTCQLAKAASDGGKAIVTTITKRFAEDLAHCLASKPPVKPILGRPLNVAFLHSGIDSVSRMHVLEAMRASSPEEFSHGLHSNSGENRHPLDVVVGVNLLREGIDFPAVQLVAILDADSEGFLRGETALIQMMGRAARNVQGHVIMYADTITFAMRRAMDETARRRKLQIAYNSLHGVNPSPVRGPNPINSEQAAPLLERIRKMKDKARHSTSQSYHPSALSKDSRARSTAKEESSSELDAEAIREKMLTAAASEDFETAALLRDRLVLMGVLKH